MAKPIKKLFRNLERKVSHLRKTTAKNKQLPEKTGFERDAQNIRSYFPI